MKAAALCFSGLGENATSLGQGMQTIAARIAAETQTPVQRFGHWNADEALAYLALGNVERVVLVGHSFGGATAVEVSCRVGDMPVWIYAVDPVPREWAGRWTRGAIEVPFNVREAICIRRSQWFGPLSKNLTGRNVTNVVRSGGHNTVLRHTETIDGILSMVRRAEMA